MKRENLKASKISHSNGNTNKRTKSVNREGKNVKTPIRLTSKQREHTHNDNRSCSPMDMNNTSIELIPNKEIQDSCGEKGKHDLLQIYRDRLEDKEKEVNLLKVNLNKLQCNQGRPCMSNSSNYKNPLLLGSKRKVITEAVYRPKIYLYNKVRHKSYQYNHPVKRAAWSNVK